MRDSKIYTTSADYAYQELRHKIITKQLKPGQRLPEVNVAVQMGVSRTPVREALRRLSSEGLVIIIPNSGARLASPSAKEMEDSFIVREMLECLSVSLAAEKVQDKHLRRMEELILDEVRAVEEKNLEFYLEAYEGFHRTVAEASCNRILADYIENILARTNAYVVFFDPFYEQEENPTLGEHKAILGALERRDSSLAVDLMKSHLRRSVSCLKLSDH